MTVRGFAAAVDPISRYIVFETHRSGARLWPHLDDW